MLDDLTKEIKAQLYERVKSPLFGAFALSWVAWNYRPLLAVLSKMSFKEKIEYFDTLYPTFWHWLGYCIAGPLAVAVVFLLVYPYPARWVYRYWANQHKELKKVQQEIEDETPMTQEEAKALRKTSLEQVTQFQAQLRDMSQANRELNERLTMAAEERVRLAKERDQFAEDAKKTREELSKHLSEVVQDSRPFNASEAIAAVAKMQKEDPERLQKAINNTKASPFKYQPVGHPLPKSADEIFDRSKQSDTEAANEDSARAYHALAKLDGATTKELAELLQWDVDKTQAALMDLVRNGKAVRDGGLWGLSAIGKYAKRTEFGFLGP